MADVHKIFSLVVGILLVLMGIYGIFSKTLFGIFSINIVLGIIYIIGGALMIWLSGRIAGLWLGWISTVLGVLGFIPFIDGLFLYLLNINMATTIMHLAFGLIAIAITYTVKEG